MERFTDASQAPFLTKGLGQFGTDYYAVLGVPMDAPLTEIRRSYRNIARLLHPDRFVREMTGKDEAELILSRVVNPAFEVLSSESQRRDYDRVLQSWAQRLYDRKEILPNYPQLLLMLQAKTIGELQTFYRKSIFEQSVHLYKDQTDLKVLSVANELSIQNLGYVMSVARVGPEAILPPRTQPPAAMRTQSPIAPRTQPPQIASTNPIPPTPTPPRAAGASFAASHFERGKNLLDRRLYKEAVNSLKEACRLDPNNATYHASLGQAYLRQGLPGMAKAEFTKALALDPADPVAKKEMGKGAVTPPVAGGKATTKAPPKGSDKEEDKGAFQKLWDNLNKPL